jgi:hypothetical protein
LGGLSFRLRFTIDNRAGEHSRNRPDASPALVAASACRKGSRQPVNVSVDVIVKSKEFDGAGASKAGVNTGPGGARNVGFVLRKRRTNARKFRFPSEI